MDKIKHIKALNYEGPTLYVHKRKDSPKVIISSHVEFEHHAFMLTKTATTATINYPT